MQQSTLLQKLKYDPNTGIFRRLDGTVAKGYVKDGYQVISVCGKQYLAHRLAFIYMTGSCPAVVDHINRDRLCNVWGNLRPVDRAGNAQNASLRKDSTSGYRGVSFRKSNSKWRAYIQSGSKQIHIGFFDTAEAAYKARQEVITSHHKQNSNKE